MLPCSVTVHGAEPELQVQGMPSDLFTFPFFFFIMCKLNKVAIHDKTIHL